jgi:hypothetical protein
MSPCDSTAIASQGIFKSWFRTAAEIRMRFIIRRYVGSGTELNRVP